MRILLLSTQPPGSQTGVRVHCDILCEQASLAGHVVERVTHLDCSPRVRRVAVWCIRFAALLGNLSRQIMPRVMYRWMSAHACRGRTADLVAAQDIMVARGARDAMGSGVPVLVTCHCSDPVEEVVRAARFTRLEGWIFGCWFRRQFEPLRDYVCVSEYAAGNLRRWVPATSRITVIHNGVPLDDGQATKLDKPTGQQVILNVGRLEPLKNQALLIRAMAHIPRSDVELWLVGDGPDRTALQALAAELGVTARLRFLGVRRDVRALMRLADLYVHVSLMENFPLVLPEAMLSGCAVLALDAGGVCECFGPGTEEALLPTTIDATTLAATIDGWLSAPSRLMKLRELQATFASGRFTAQGM
ncbi:MAG: glycosyltransferase family 4 protein, partial [bacterium]